MVVVNLFDDNWDLDEQHGGFGGRDAWIGARLGSELIGGTLYAIDAGKKLCPYHLHHANEEWLIVLRGRPDIVEYPDSQKVGAHDARGGPLFFGRPGPMLDYWDGED